MLEDVQLDPELMHLLVFGPGYGESVLVRSPPGVWLAVDALRQQGPVEDINPALAALDMFAATLSAVVLTHPHEDHARGLVQLLERRHPRSPVGCVPGFIRRPSESRTNPDATLVLDDASARAALNRIDHIWRSDVESRWPLLTGSTRELGYAEMQVLSPPTVPRRLPRDLNRLSSPLLVEWRDCRLVLGADLPRARWSAVSRLPVAAQVTANQGLKVAHHASRGAQHPVAIGEPPPGDRACVVTPFNKGRQLPSYADGHGIDQLLVANRRVRISAVPAHARGKETPRTAMVPEQEALGELTLAYEQPAGRPQQAWVAAAFDSAGTRVDLRAGDAAGTVIA
jgi:hypothetical protein